MEHAKLNGRRPRRGALVTCAVGLLAAGTIAALAPTAAGADPEPVNPRRYRESSCPTPSRPTPVRHGGRSSS